MAVIEAAGAGDIISMAGLSGPAIGHTVANPEVGVTLCFDWLLVAVQNVFSFSIVSNSLLSYVNVIVCRF